MVKRTTVIKSKSPIKKEGGVYGYKPEMKSKINNFLYGISQKRERGEDRRKGEEEVLREEGRLKKKEEEEGKKERGGQKQVGGEEEERRDEDKSETNAFEQSFGRDNSYSFHNAERVGEEGMTRSKSANLADESLLDQIITNIRNINQKINRFLC